jgi:hypothetical protein
MTQSLSHLMLAARVAKNWLSVTSSESPLL